LPFAKLVVALLPKVQQVALPGERATPARRSTNPRAGRNGTARRGTPCPGLDIRGVRLVPQPNGVITVLVAARTNAIRTWGSRTWLRMETASPRALSAMWCSFTHTTTTPRALLLRRVIAVKQDGRVVNRCAREFSARFGRSSRGWSWRSCWTWSPTQHRVPVRYSPVS
jgi:hypothetical protein